MSSKPGAIGNDMRSALKGEQNHKGGMSSNYIGRPGNAIPGHPHHPDNSQSVSDWTKNSLKDSREKARDNSK